MTGSVAARRRRALRVYGDRLGPDRAELAEVVAHLLVGDLGMVSANVAAPLEMKSPVVLVVLGPLQ